MSELISLYIGNLDHDVTKAELEDHFRPYGRPIRTYISQSPDGNRTFAFVRFAKIESAVRAIRALHKKPFKSQVIDVAPSSENIRLDEIRKLLKDKAYSDKAMKLKEKDNLIIKQAYKLLAVKNAVRKANEAVLADGIDLGSFLTSVSKQPVNRLNPSKSKISFDTKSSLQQCLKLKSDSVKPLMEYEKMKLVIQKNKMLQQVPKPLTRSQPPISKVLPKRSPTPPTTPKDPPQLMRQNSTQSTSSSSEPIEIPRLATNLDLTPSKLTDEVIKPNAASEPQPLTRSQPPISKFLPKRSPTPPTFPKDPPQLMRQNSTQSTSNSSELVDIPRLATTLDLTPPKLTDEVIKPNSASKVTEQALLPFENTIFEPSEALQIDSIDNREQTGSGGDVALQLHGQISIPPGLIEKINPRPLNQHESALLEKLKDNGTPPPTLHDGAAKDPRKLPVRSTPALKATEELKREQEITPPPCMKAPEAKPCSITPPPAMGQVTSMNELPPTMRVRNHGNNVVNRSMFMPGYDNYRFRNGINTNFIQRPYFTGFPRYPYNVYHQHGPNLAYQPNGYPIRRDCLPQPQLGWHGVPVQCVSHHIRYKQPHQLRGPRPFYSQRTDNAFRPRLHSKIINGGCTPPAPLSFGDKEIESVSNYSEVLEDVPAVSTPQALRTHSVNTSSLSECTDSSSPSESDVSSPSINHCQRPGLGRGMKLQKALDSFQ